MPVNLQHLQLTVNATKTEKEHFQSLCAVSGIQNNFNPTRNLESARRNAPDSIHGGEIHDIKCKTGQPTQQLQILSCLCLCLFCKATHRTPVPMMVTLVHTQLGEAHSHGRNIHRQMT